MVDNKPKPVSSSELNEKRRQERLNAGLVEVRLWVPFDEKEWYVEEQLDSLRGINLERLGTQLKRGPRKK